MQSKTKIFLAVAIAALIVVVALIVLGSRQPDKQAAEPAPQATQEPISPQAEPDPEQEEAPEQADPEIPATMEDIPESELYEGALAGLTEEEIGRMAMAEENVNIDELGEDGVD